MSRTPANSPGCFQSTLELFNDLRELKPSPPKRPTIPKDHLLVWDPRGDRRKDLTSKLSRDKRRPHKPSSHCARTSPARDSSTSDLKIYVQDRSSEIGASNRSAIPVRTDGPTESTFQSGDLPGLDNLTSCLSPLAPPVNLHVPVSASTGTPAYQFENHALPETGNALDLSLFPQTDYDQGLISGQRAGGFLSGPISTGGQSVVDVEQSQCSEPLVDLAFKCSHHVESVCVFRCTICGLFLPFDALQIGLNSVHHGNMDNPRPWSVGGEESYLAGPSGLAGPSSPFNRTHFQAPSQNSIPGISLPPAGPAESSIFDDGRLTDSTSTWQDRAQSHTVLPRLLIPNTEQYRQRPSPFSVSASSESSSELVPTPESTVSNGLLTPDYIFNNTDGSPQIQDVYLKSQRLRIW